MRLLILLFLAIPWPKALADDFQYQILPDQTFTITKILNHGEALCVNWIFASISYTGARPLALFDRRRCLIAQNPERPIVLTLTTPFIDGNESAVYSIADANKEAIRTLTETPTITAILGAASILVGLGVLLFISSLNPLYLFFAIATTMNFASNANILMPADLFGFDNTYLEGPFWAFLSNALPLVNTAFVLELVRKLLVFPLKSKFGYIGGALIALSLLLTTAQLVIFSSPPLLTAQSLNYSVLFCRLLIQSVLLFIIIIIISRMRFTQGSSRIPHYLLPSFLLFVLGALIYLSYASDAAAPLVGRMSYLLGSLGNGLFFFLAIGRSHKERDDDQKTALEQWAKTLDRKVEERTAEISTVLNSSEADILFFDDKGLLKQSNAEANLSFSECKDLRALLECLEATPLEIEALLATLGDNTIAWEMNEPNFKTTSTLHDRHLVLKWGMVDLADTVKGVILTVVDVTDTLMAQKKAQGTAEEAARVYQLTQISPAARSRLSRDIELLATALSGEDNFAWKAPAHTLKGNALSLGFERLGALIHGLEEGHVSKQDVLDEMKTMEQIRSDIFGGRGLIMDEKKAIDAMDHDQAQPFLENILYLPIDSIVQDNPAYLASARLAERLQKIPPNLKVVGGHIKLHPRLAETLSITLTHAIRNSIDHGLETPDERIRAGKPAQGSIVIEALAHDKSVLIRITDDGRGLNLKALRKKFGSDIGAKDLARKILASGVSTKDLATDISGRGVGMHAAKTAIEALGGSINVILESELTESEPFAPMTIQLVFPE